MSRGHAYRGRRDITESLIVAALRAAGAMVVRLAPDDRAGVPDLLVGKAGRWHVLEVKRPTGPRGGDSEHGQALGAAQVEFIYQEFIYQAEIRGLRVHVVRTPDEALAAIGVRVVA